jgi:hypothetical protein
LDEVMKSKVNELESKLKIAEKLSKIRGNK